MSTLPPFEGFPEDGLNFLAELKENNNKEWFEANKKRYKEQLQQPALSFIDAIGQKLQAISDGIRYDIRTNGGGSLMRINRDVRFSKDKSPYKTNLAMVFWEGAGKKMEHSGFGMQITAEIIDSGLMAGQFGFSKEMLEAYRQAVVDDELGTQMIEAVEAVQSAGDYNLNGQHYKRVPRGMDADHPRADWLFYNGLWFSYPSLTREEILSPDLVDICFQHFKNMSPIQQWLVKIEP